MTSGRVRFATFAASMCMVAASAPSSAQVQTSAQSTCIVSMNDSAAKVAKAELGVARKCLKAASTGRLEAGQSAQQCLTADNSGKVAKATSAASDKAGAVCVSPLPDFGYTSPSALSSAAMQGALGLYDGIFGDDLGLAVIDAATDKPGAKCQATVAKSAGKLLGAMLAEFRSCKKAGLAAESITSTATLALCLGAIDSDAKGKVGKAESKLAAAAASACSETSQAPAFPGDCSAAAGLATCLEVGTRCRACTIFNSADALGQDCDDFDDAIDNDSCGTPTSGLTVTHGMTLPAEHPRLWFNPSRLERARSWYESNPFTPPTNEDSAAGYADVALHGLLTDNATGSCTTAINWGLSRLGDVDDTGGVACDACRWTGEQLILVYDWCYAYLTPVQRSTYAAGMQTGLSAWSQKSWGGPAMYQNNYYWGYLRNELEWSITAYDQSPSWAESMLDWDFTSRLANNFDPSTEAGGNSRGGIAYEGSEYGPVVGAYPLVPFVSANLMGRNLYEETSFWRELVYSIIHSTPPAPSTVPGVAGTGYTVFPFSDDEGWNERFQAETHYFPDFMTTMASYWPTENVGRHARQWVNMVGVTPWRQVQAVDVPNTPLVFDSLPLDFYASGPRYLYGRNAWGAGSTVFMLQLGDADESTIGHQHGDYGTFQIWRGGRFVSHETAGYSGDGSTEVAGYAGVGSVDSALGVAHNTVLVNGANPGPQYSGPSAVVERLESRPGYTFAVVDLIPPATALQEWRREFVFVRALETLVVFDRLQTASASATKTFLNHCETIPAVSGDDSATCTVGTQAVRMTTLLPVPAQRDYRVVDEGSHTNSQYRIEVDTTPGTAQSYILNVLQARDALGTNLAPSVMDNGTSYTVTLDASTSITFEKGTSSTGGSIRIGGVTTPFRADVQSMSVTGDGPVWAP